MRAMVPEKILGWDDWLVYGRTADGTLVFTVAETDWHWLEAPHGGNHQCGCPGTMSACRVDLSWMLAWITGHRAEYDWLKCGRDTDGTYLGWPESGDAAFMASSRASYLCD